MADRLIGTVCMAVVAVVACSCGPDEAAAQSPPRTVVAGIGGLPLSASREPPEALPPEPVSPASVPVEAVEPVPQPALITTVVLTDLPAPVPTVPEPGIADLSHRIENVMSTLDQLVAESLRLQDSLLRLRLSSKRPDPDDDGAGSP